LIWKKPKTGFYSIKHTVAVEVKETATPHDLTVLTERAKSIGLSEQRLEDFGIWEVVFPTTLMRPSTI